MKFKWKKCLVLTLVMAILVAPLGSGFAAESQSLIPLRTFVNDLGGSIDWLSDEQIITFNLPTGTYVYQVKTGVLTRQGIPWHEPIVPQIKNGTTYVDADFIQSVLGLNGALSENGFEAQRPKTLETKNLPPEGLALRERLKSYLVFEQWQNDFDGQVLVAVGEAILVHQAFGKANLLTGVNATTEDTYSIGSITKQLTAYAIMTLETQGLLSYEDTIDKHLDQAPYGDVITIHHLLAHTSGLPEFTDALFTEESFADYEVFATYVGAEPLKFEPGSDWSYSNSGYYLLGKIVEAITGEALETYLEKTVFSPLEMKATGWAFKDGALQMTTVGSMEGQVEEAYAFDQILLSVAEGAGAVMSNVYDVYLWQKALYGGDLLEEEALALMAGISENENINPNFGYGLVNVQTPFGLEFGHGGNTVGYTASTTYLPALDVHVVILSNRGYVNLNGIKNNLYTLLSGGDVSLEPKEVVEIPALALEKLAGTFDFNGLFKIRMFAHEGRLMLQVEGQPAIGLTAVSAVRFENQTFGVVIEYDDAEAPTAFMLYQNGQEFKGVKIVE